MKLKYIGQDDWYNFVYEDENGKLWKHECAATREIPQERGDRPRAASGNAFDGEPDYQPDADTPIEYVN